MTQDCVCPVLPNGNHNTPVIIMIWTCDFDLLNMDGIDYVSIPISVIYIDKFHNFDVLSCYLSSPPSSNIFVRRRRL